MRSINGFCVAKYVCKPKKAENETAGMVEKRKGRKVNEVGK